MWDQEQKMSQKKKTLIIRLSSLGDVILTTSSLESSALKDRVDWVVAKEYAAVLRGHPRIHTLWEYDRKLGKITSWIHFGRTLWNTHYDEVIDLHGSIRTRILRVLFFLWSIVEFSKRPRWKVATKQRFRSFGFIIFKNLWPKRLLSEKQVTIFAKTTGGSGEERPDLRYLLANNTPPADLPNIPYFCVMPSSNWPGKTWSHVKYFEVIKKLGFFPVIMGRHSDTESNLLVLLLQKSGLPHFSGIGKWDLAQSAWILTKSKGYLGSDTGLAHLAEAVGTPIIVVYGPTAPGLGFEPWRPGSGTAGAKLWCRPCGKIGRWCFRLPPDFRCLKILKADPVIKEFHEKFKPDGCTLK